MHKSTSEFLTESRTRRDNLIYALPGTFDSARSEKSPIMARRPLFTSALRPRAFFSSDAYLKRLKGS